MLILSIHGNPWEYCNVNNGPNELIYFSSQSGVMCTGSCVRLRSNYEWCLTGQIGEWAYERCSSKFGYSSDRRRCSDRCQLHGNMYKCTVPIDGHHDELRKRR